MSALTYETAPRPDGGLYVHVIDCGEVIDIVAFGPPVTAEDAVARVRGEREAR